MITRMRTRKHAREKGMDRSKRLKDQNADGHETNTPAGCSAVVRMQAPLELRSKSKLRGPKACNAVKLSQSDRSAQSVDQPARVRVCACVTGVKSAGRKAGTNDETDGFHMPSVPC